MGLMTSDSGIFQCFASNPAGNIQSAASLKVVTNSGMVHNIDILLILIFIERNIVNSCLQILSFLWYSLLLLFDIVIVFKSNT